MKIQRFFKRQIDFFGSLFGLIVLAPLFLIIAVLIKIDSPGPVFFRQERVGKDGKIFRIWKFRTMVEGAEKIGLGFRVAKRDLRITNVGRFLRRLGIDELPQFVNVIFGEMSLVGPRPTLMYQVAKYSEFEKRRLLVKPGMASLALIRGRNSLSWKERIELDIWYIENWSLWLDLKILFKAPFSVLSGKGLYNKEGIVEDYE